MTGQNVSYEPIVLIECNDFNDRNKKFNKLIQKSEELKLNDIIHKPETLWNKIQSPCYLYQDIINENEIPNTAIASQNNGVKQNGVSNANTVLIPAHNNLILKNNMITLSDRLKVMILLAVSQKYEPEKKIEKAH